MQKKNLYGFRENIFLFVSTLRYEKESGQKCICLCTEAYRSKDKKFPKAKNAQDYWMHTVNERDYWTQAFKALNKDLRNWKKLGPDDVFGLLKADGKETSIGNSGPNHEITYWDFAVYKEGHEGDCMHLSKALIDDLRRWKKIGKDEVLGPSIIKGEVKEHFIKMGSNRASTIWRFGSYGPGNGKPLEEVINEYLLL